MTDISIAWPSHCRVINQQPWFGSLGVHKSELKKKKLNDENEGWSEATVFGGQLISRKKKFT